MSKSIIDRIRSVFKASEELSAHDKQVAAYNKSRTGGSHNTFCHAPSVNMYFSQDGSVKACCHNMEFSIGNYPQQTLKEIWNSAKALEFRDKMRRNDLSDGCQICAADLQLGAFDEVRARHFDKLPRNPHYPTMMEFLLTNICNLECVMCWGENSSLIRKNREKLPPMVSPYDKEFINQLKEFLPHLHETRFSGSGEAFSIDMNYEIWELLVASNPGCLIMVQTNGTILTGRVKEILAKGKFQIGVSLDSLNKETYEAIRINANFDKVMENIRYFNEYCHNKGTRFSIATCVMRQNWRELPAFIDFCNSMDAVATFHKVWQPQEYGLHNLPRHELQQIHAYLASFDFPTETLHQQENRRHYHYFVSVVENWMTANPTTDPETLLVNSLPGTELWPYLRDKLKTNIAVEPISDKEKEALFEFSINKFESMLNSFTETSEQEIILRQACATPAKIFVHSFQKYPVEFLFNEAKKTLKNQTPVAS